MRALPVCSILICGILASCATNGPGDSLSGQAPFADSLEKAKTHDHLNAFTYLNTEFVGGETLPSGRLSGMVLAVKDNIHVAGQPNTAGTPGLEGFVPTKDAPVMARLKEEGALVLGKANMHELAFGITSDNARFGPVRNPYDTTRFAGGSSGGSGAAVAARIVPAAIGSDTGGSVRIPAALCGIIGFRPSPGRYPEGGVTPISRTRDVTGPMALTMEDITLLDSVMAARPQVTTAVDLSTLRLGIARDPFFQDIDPETKSLMDATLRNLSEAGVTLVEMDMHGLTELTEKAGNAIALYEAVFELEAYLKEYKTGMDFFDLAGAVSSPDVNAVFKNMAGDTNGDGRPDGMISKSVYDQAVGVHRPALITYYHEYFSNEKIDALIFPTTVLPAAPVKDSAETVTHNGRKVPTFPTYIRNTNPGSTAGLPGITLPVGLTSDGLPVGMGLDGLPDSDERLLSIALALEPLLKKLPAPRM